MNNFTAHHFVYICHNGHGLLEQIVILRTAVVILQNTEHKVVVYQVRDWPRTSDVPNNPAALLTVADLVLSGPTNDGPMLLCCAYVTPVAHAFSLWMHVCWLFGDRMLFFMTKIFHLADIDMYGKRFRAPESPLKVYMDQPQLLSW